MKPGISICFFLLILASHDARASSAADDHINPPQPTTLSFLPYQVSDYVLPFRLSHDYLILMKGQIGSRTNLTFILDTGTSMSVVDSKVADALKLPRQPSRSFNFDRYLAFDRATFPEIDFGPIRASNAVTLVGHLADYFEFAQGVDAIIGLDLMQSTNFTVDYQAGTIRFHPPAVRAPAKRDSLPIEFLSIDVFVQGRLLRLIVDTGFPGMLLFEERIALQASALKFSGASSFVTIGGRLHARSTTLRGIAIGSIHTNLPVFLTKAPPSTVAPEIAGVIGISALHARQVDFNFLENSFSWR